MPSFFMVESRIALGTGGAFGGRVSLVLGLAFGLAFVGVGLPMRGIPLGFSFPVLGLLPSAEVGDDVCRRQIQVTIWLALRVFFVPVVPSLPLPALIG